MTKWIVDEDGWSTQHVTGMRIAKPFKRVSSLNEETYSFQEALVLGDAALKATEKLDDRFLIQELRTTIAALVVALRKALQP